jgi:hypothetical protein
VTAAINLGAFPQALGQNIQRIDPKTGLATQPTLDSEFFLAEWVKDNTQALDNFAVDVQTAADNAQTTADEGLGLANQATAFGRMRLNAVTAPAGTTARFSVELEASPGSGIWYATGFYMDVTSGGTSRISFVASQFLFIDPSFNGGLAAVVLQYLSGAWYYNVPVILRTGELDANAASKLRSTTGSGSSLSLIVTDFLVASELNVLAIGSVTTGYIDSTVTAIPTAPMSRSCSTAVYRPRRLLQSASIRGRTIRAALWDGEPHHRRDRDPQHKGLVAGPDRGVSGEVQHEQHVPHDHGQVEHGVWLDAKRGLVSIRCGA